MKKFLLIIIILGLSLVGCSSTPREPFNIDKILLATILVDPNNNKSIRKVNGVDQENTIVVTKEQARALTVTFIIKNKFYSKPLYLYVC